ncbi:MAG TPA: hypothetical protein VIX85_11755 [Acidimicrobiales bacterium]
MTDASHQRTWVRKGISELENHASGEAGSLTKGDGGTALELDDQRQGLNICETRATLSTPITFLAKRGCLASII